jgi:hypothetical protein
VLADRIKFQHRSDATKWFHLVRSPHALALEFSSGAHDALDKMRLRFVSFSRFSRKKENDLKRRGHGGRGDE